MSSLLPGFEYDIFISYRQKDNKYDGWVTEFIANLRKELEATFKEDVSIYFDENPHDGLLETHNVSKSLESRLKCLIFIPIISQTYCDPKSFAWQHEFLAFVGMTAQDRFGKTITLANGNKTGRFLSVRIHDLDEEDIQLFEKETHEVMRPVDFIYRLPGVNRPLRAKDDEQIKSPNQILYRDQINKVARAIKDIITSLKKSQNLVPTVEIKRPVTPEPEQTPQRPQAREESRPKSNRKYRLVMWGVPVALLIVAAFLVVPKWINRQIAINELLPEIQKMTEDNYIAPSRAFEMATAAETSLAADSSLIKLWPKVSRKITLQTDPPGADLYWKDYDRPKDSWKKIGTSPFQNTRIPQGYLRIKIEKQGFQTIVMTSTALTRESSLKLESLGALPVNMVRIPSRKSPMLIVGLEQHAGKMVGEFLVDQFEVTNKEYKRFVDAGGYTNKSFWNYPIYLEGKEISWESAMNLFVDKTGKQGPAGWEVGKYPDGKEDHPVSGINWYEASAYASFAKKKLPTVYQWSNIADTWRTMNIIPMSNFNGNSTVAAGSKEGMSSFGVYDVAGNVREWCYNESRDRGQHYILGGGWNDPTYSFNDAFTQPATDRSLSNGFRCIRDLPGDTTISSLSTPVDFAFRDYHKEKPVDDNTFKIFSRQYSYDKSPLNAQVKAMADSSIWKIEKVTMDAGYNKDRLVVYLFLPREARPPYQPIILFPGSNVIYTDVLTSNQIRRMDFFLKSGRALILPIFKGTFERRDGLNSDLADESVNYKDHVIMWRKDLGRTLDYLETRKDMLSDKVGYFGVSWGGYMGGLIPAVERRIKAIVLHVGGMEMNRSLPEVDQLNFLPRVYQPVLMLNGKHDMFFPVETSQKPMFDFLGTPAKDKKIIIYETGHLVPWSELIKETLAWFDRYLGPVK